MKSIYKWKIQDGVYAYIMSESTTTPFLSTGETPARETAISDNVNSQSESTYKQSFEAMEALIVENYPDFTGLKDYSAYFNYDNSACYDVGNVGLCPKIIFEKTVTLAAGTNAYTTLLGSYVEPDGTIVYRYELGIPSGAQGVQGAIGMQGIQGVQGATGSKGAQGEDGEDGEPGKDGITPAAQYVSIIFKRDNNLNPTEDLAKLNGAQPVVPDERNPYYEKPLSGFDKNGNFIERYLEDKLDWYDSIPSADTQNNRNAKVWISRKTFSTADDWGKYTWSEPSLATDNDKTDREWNIWTEDPDPKDSGDTILTLDKMKVGGKYQPLRQSPNDDKPDFLPDYKGRVMTVEEWKANGRVDYHGWHDEPIDDAIWMAENEIENGEYVEPSNTGWVVTKVKGEDGKDGEPLKLKEEWDGDKFFEPTYNPRGDKGIEINEAHVCASDSTFVDEVTKKPCFEKGHIYVWDGDSWVDGGVFTGKAAYLHIKYANESVEGSEGAGYVNIGSTGSPIMVWIKWTDESGETPNGDYTGIYTDNEEDDVLDYQKYKWTYSKGMDGFGYEYVYCATREEMDGKILVPTGGTQYAIGTSDIVKENWTWESDVYQDNFDFIPKNVVVKDEGELSGDIECILWQDELIMPTREIPYVYEVYRKKEQNGKWSKFIGTKDGYAALAKTFTSSPDFKSTIFKRSNVWFGESGDTLVNEEWENLKADKTATYDNPVPEVLGWSDGIPAGNEMLWRSFKTFTKDKGKTGEKYEWSKPTLAEDSPDMEYEWNPEHPEWTSVESPDFHGPERTSPIDTADTKKDRYGWCDNPVDGAIWMAQCNIKGGVYEQKDGSYNPQGKDPNWVFTRVKGEKGDKGEDGIDGQGAVFLDLTNEMDSVFLGNDKKLDIDNPMDFTTTVYIASGLTKEVPKNITVTPQGDYAGVTYSLSADTGDIKVTIQDKTVFPEEGFRFKITGALGEFSGEVTYKILGIPGGKDGTVYRIVCMPSNVTFKYYNGSYHRSNISVSVKGYKGLDELTGCTIYYSIGTDPLEDPTRGTRVTNEEIPISDNYYTYDGSSIFAYLYADVPNYGSMLVDRETIPVLKDGEKGEDGVGSVVMALSNPVDSVTTGDNSILDADSVVLGTYINGTYGDDDVDSITATITPSEYVTQDQQDHISVNFNSSTNYCSFTLSRGLDFGSNMNIEYYINATGTYSNETGTHTASYKFTFRMCGVKNGPAGQEGVVLRLKTSTGSIIYKNGTYDPTQISATYEQAGTEVTAGIKFEFKGKWTKTNISPNTLVGISGITDAEMGFINVKAFSGTTILDEANIPIIPAGKDGTGIVADLSNEQDLVGLGDDYIFMNEASADTGITFETTVSIFNGTDTLEIDSITIDDSTTGSKTYSQSSTGKKVTITAADDGKSKKLSIAVQKGIDFSQSPFNEANSLIVPIVVTGELDNVAISRNAKYTLLGFKGGKDGVVMRVQPSVNIIKQIIDDSGLVDSYIPEKIKFNFTANGKISESGIILGYAVDKDPIIEETTSWETGKTWNTEYNLKTGFGQDIDNFIVVAAFSGNTMLDKEIIPIIRDGKDGSGGDAKLDKIFKKIDSDGGAYLRQFIGVSNSETPVESNIVAFMNGSSAVTVDNKTIMIAAGCQSGTTIEERANSALFQVFSDGTIKATSGIFSGFVQYPYYFISKLSHGSSYYIADTEHANLIADGYSGSYGMGDGGCLMIPEPCEELNGFTYQILAVPNFVTKSASESTAISIVTADSMAVKDSPFKVYTHLGTSSYSYGKLKFYGGHISLTCLPVQDDETVGYYWALTEATGGVDCYGDASFEWTGSGTYGSSGWHFDGADNTAYIQNPALNHTGYGMRHFHTSINPTTVRVVISGNTRSSSNIFYLCLDTTDINRAVKTFNGSTTTSYSSTFSDNDYHTFYLIYKKTYSTSSDVVNVKFEITSATSSLSYARSIVPVCGYSETTMDNAIVNIIAESGVEQYDKMHNTLYISRN